MKLLKLIVLFLFLSSIVLGKTLKELNPIFSKEAGFYDTPFYLELSSNVKNAKIYYTLDGSEPIPGEKNTYLYNKPIEIKSRENEKNVFSNIKTSIFWNPPKGLVFKGTIIRARAFLGDNKSKIITKTYFIAPKNKYSFIVISVVTDPENLFDYEKGIYVLGKTFEEDKYNSEEFKGNFHQNGKEWEREAHIEFFENGNLVYEDDMGIRIHGGFTATFPLKSLRLYARDKYGKKKIEYPVFPNNFDVNGKLIKKYDKLILRNGGNDFEITIFRDAFVHELLKNMNFDIQAFRPAIHFINGEYWGIINLRERYDDDYLEEHYKLNKKDIVILEATDDPENKIHYEVDEGEKGDEKSFLELKRFIVNYDMSIPQNYEYVKSRIDIDNYINYVVSEIYIDNRDWPGNNVRLWRKKQNFSQEYSHDGKWRFMLFDTDNSLFLYDYNTIKHAIDGNPNVVFPNPIWSTEMLKNLLDNNDFRNKFLNTFMDHINTTFLYDNTTKLIDKFKELYISEIKEHINRWNFPKSLEYWIDNVEYMKEFFRQRPKYIIKYLEEYFNIKSKSIFLQEFIGGHIKINSVYYFKSQEIVYFNNIPIHLSAVNENGYEFKYWIINGKKVENKDLLINPKNVNTIKLVFEKE